MNEKNKSMGELNWIIDLGLCDFERSLTIQKKLHQMRAEAKIPDTLILVEHQPVITFGKSGKPANLLVPNDILQRKGIKTYFIERGGDVTFHGPGQIVGYPIFYIKETLAGIRGVIEKLESTLILTLNDFAIQAVTKPKLVGVWVGEEKIASIGIAVKKWVTFHGFAINVNTDLSYFDLIRPCGLDKVKMTSMAKILGKESNLNQVKESIILNFEKVFNIKIGKPKDLEKLTS
jgi:lipoate-protein ligase B